MLIDECRSLIADSGLKVGDRWIVDCGLTIDSRVIRGGQHEVTGQDRIQSALQSTMNSTIQSTTVNPQSSDRQSTIDQSTTSDLQSSITNLQ
jgi:hypothetical protein